VLHYKRNVETLLQVKHQFLVGYTRKPTFFLKIYIKINNCYAVECF